jgi:hypothetical protein
MIFFFANIHPTFSVSFYSFLSLMLEKLFYIMSLCRHFMSLNHLVDVVRTGLEYVPRVPLEMSTLIFILFIFNYMKIRI